MKLVTWIVALYNRRWQKKLDAMIVQLDKEDSRGKLIIKYEPVVDRSIPTKEEVIEAIDSQPTHLSSKFKPRPKRKYKRKEVDGYADISD